MSPVDDTFLTSSVDGTVKLWDVGMAGNALGVMRLPSNVEGSPIAAFDCTGLVFGICGKIAGEEGHVSLMCVLILSFRAPSLNYYLNAFHSTFSSMMQGTTA